jgi:N-acetylglutamate synthase-like GNAT family acetyltransferase
VDEYSPSIAEIVSVAVDRSEQRRGLGSQVVLAAEQVARQRGFERVFAMSLAEEFFTALGYDVTPLDTFPEKVARYEKLSADGVDTTPSGWSSIARRSPPRRASARLLGRTLC